MSFENGDNPESFTDPWSAETGGSDDTQWQESIEEPAITAPGDDGGEPTPDATHDSGSEPPLANTPNYFALRVPATDDTKPRVGGIVGADLEYIVGKGEPTGQNAAEPPVTPTQESWLGLGIAPALSPLERSDDDPDKPFLEFRQPFDGSQPEIPPEQQIEAGTAFAGFVDEEVDEGSSKSGIKVDDNGDLLLVKVSNGNSQTSPEILTGKHVRIDGLEWAPGGVRLTGYAADYKLDIDGAVRRNDYRPRTLEEYARDQERMAALREIPYSNPATMTSEELSRVAAGLRDALHELLAERLTPRELGEQNQPVSPEEVEKLIRLARGQ